MKQDRRSFIQGVGSTALLSTLPMGALAESSNPTTTSIGNFDEGLEGWQANEGNELAQISSESVPGVLDGDNGLAVITKQANEAVLTETATVRDVDLVESRCLVADVVPSIADSNSTVRFQFALGYSDQDESTQSDEADERGSESQQLVSSPSQEIPQYQKSTISWNLSDVGEDAKSRATHLEIKWDTSDGQTESDSDPKAYAIFDDVRLLEDVTEANIQVLNQKLTNLRLEHGVLMSVEVAEERDDFESGTFVYRDGTEVQYVFERISDDKYRYTVDDSEYKLGGDWA